MIKHQVKLNFHLSEWFLKPIILKGYVMPDNSAKITQVTWLFISFRNVLYNDGTMDFKKK